MKKTIPLIIIFFLYLCFLLLFARDSISFRYDGELTNKYFKSQDIVEKIDGRVFLSDSELYQAVGYLYARGENPKIYNFQHPPLVKYLIGYSILLFGNPFVSHFLFGFGILVLTYFLGIGFFKKSMISYLSVLLLLLDPLFLDFHKEVLLDLGHTFFGLLFIYLFLFHSKKIIFQAIAFGLFVASKFWSTAVLVLVFLLLFKVFVQKKKAFTRNLLLMLGISVVVFGLTYLKTFVSEGFFNIVFLQAKQAKYMLVHNSGKIPFANLILFVSGYFATWWEKLNIVRSDIWSVLWPITFFVSLYEVVKKIIKKKPLNDVFVFAFPLFILFSMVSQVPFSRYFLFVLPFFYLGFSKVVLGFLTADK